MARKSIDEIADALERDAHANANPTPHGPALLVDEAREASGLTGVVSGMPPHTWVWGDSENGTGWHPVPERSTDPSQKWRQFVSVRELTGPEILLARSHMCGFLRAVDPSYKTWWASDLIADRITMLSRRMRGHTGPGTLGALIVREPPQHGKTYLCEENAPPFMAAQDPSAQILNLCYARELAARNIRVCRAIMARAAYKQISRARAGKVVDEEGKTHTDEDKAAMLRFMIDGGRAGVVQGKGYYISVSPKSTLTGWSGTGQIAGDLVKTPDEAFSPTQRDKLLQRVQSMFFTRDQQDSAFLLAMSPWHPADISYQVQELAVSAGLDVEVIELPAIADHTACALHPCDPRVRGGGERLDSVRHDMAFYNRHRVMVGRFWSSLYQLKPENFGPALVPENEWTEYDPLALLSHNGALPLASVVHAYISIDTNGDENGASFAHITIALCVEYGIGDQRRRMIWKLGQEAGPWSYHEMETRTYAAIHRMGRADRIAAKLHVIIERKALGPALIQGIERSRGRLIAEGIRPFVVESRYPQGSKRARADQAHVWISAGLYCLPDKQLAAHHTTIVTRDLTDTKWKAPHRQAWGSHPNPLPGAHDLVDAESQMILYAAEQKHIKLPSLGGD